MSIQNKHPVLICRKSEALGLSNCIAAHKRLFVRIIRTYANLQTILTQPNKNANKGLFSTLDSRIINTRMVKPIGVPKIYLRQDLQWPGLQLSQQLCTSGCLESSKSLFPRQHILIEDLLIRAGCCLRLSRCTLHHRPNSWALCITETVRLIIGVPKSSPLTAECLCLLRNKSLCVEKQSYGKSLKDRASAKLA